MIREKPKLRSLFWEATLRCNAGCPFCGSSCGDWVKQPEADGDTVFKAFQSIAAAYDPRGIMVNVTGGEPLLREDLFAVMEKVHKLGFPWGLVTNASLITDEAIRSMKRTGMRTISISIDDLFEAHENLRKLPGAFPRILNSIRALAQEDFLDSIQVTTVVNRRNIDHLENMFCVFSQLPIDSWRLAIVDPIGRGKGQADLLLRKEDLEGLFAFFDRHRFSAKPVLTTSCSHYLGEADTRFRPHSFHCETGKSVASILADGSIFVCPNVPRSKELIQGNIYTDDIVSVWENKFEVFRDENKRKKGRCAQCPDWEHCKGDSLHTWDFASEQPSFCYRRYDLPGRKEAATEIPLQLKNQHPHLRGIRISYGSSSGKTVCFSESASEQLYSYFHWGQKHPANICEQMVAAVGYFSDRQAFVEELIPIPLSDRGEKTASFSMHLHKYTLNEIEVINRNLSACPDAYTGKTTPVCFLGYIHSHPGELSTTMSIPDLELQSLLGENDPARLFSGIINPQKKDLCIYWDSVYSPADVLLLTDETHVAKWTEAESVISTLDGKRLQ